MEIGNLAEWVAGIAKIIAIIGAITVPILNDRKKRKNAVTRLARREYELVEEFMNEHHESDLPFQELESYQQFKSFISMLMVVSDDDQLIKLSDQINATLDNSTDEIEFNHSMTVLLNQLKTEFMC